MTGSRAYALDVRDAAGHRETYEGVCATLADRRADAERWLDALVAAHARAVGQYLARWRMLLAARRLRESRESIETIAGTVGYDSPAAFQRAFKRQMGVTPAQWRRRVGATA